MFEYTATFLNLKAATKIDLVTYQDKIMEIAQAKKNYFSANLQVEQKMENTLTLIESEFSKITKMLTLNVE